MKLMKSLFVIMMLLGLSQVVQAQVPSDGPLATPPMLPNPTPTPVASLPPDLPSPSFPPTPLCIDPVEDIVIPCPSVPPTPPCYDPAPALRKEGVTAQAIIYCVPTPTPVATPTPTPTPVTENTTPTPTPVATPNTAITGPSNVIEGNSCNLAIAQAGLLPMQMNGYMMLIVAWLFGNIMMKRDK